MYMYKYQQRRRIKFILTSIVLTVLSGTLMFFTALGAGLGGTSDFTFFDWFLYRGSFYLTFSIYPIIHFYLIYKNLTTNY